ncbi:unnamed protein product, partial [Symbiodinium sp. KB8]
ALLATVGSKAFFHEQSAEGAGQTGPVPALNLGNVQDPAAQAAGLTLQLALSGRDAGSLTAADLPPELLRAYGVANRAELGPEAQEVAAHILRTTSWFEQVQLSTRSELARRVQQQGGAASPGEGASPSTDSSGASALLAAFDAHVEESRRQLPGNSLAQLLTPRTGHQQQEEEEEEEQVAVPPVRRQGPRAEVAIGAEAVQPPGMVPACDSQPSSDLPLPLSPPTTHLLFGPGGASGAESYAAEDFLSLSASASTSSRPSPARPTTYSVTSDSAGREPTPATSSGEKKPSGSIVPESSSSSSHSHGGAASAPHHQALVVGRPQPLPPSSMVGEKGAWQLPNMFLRPLQVQAAAAPPPSDAGDSAAQ